MTDTLFADGIGNVTLTNGVVRIELNRQAGQGEAVANGTLYIPANQAANFANALNKALRELQERLQQQQAEAEDSPETSGAAH